MLSLAFDTDAWDDYVYWQGTDKATLKRVNALIKETLRTPFEGTGKPESLKHDLAGCWSRRITQEHRMVYRVSGNTLQILKLRYHY
jgi:toxin YoeB